MKIIKVKSCKTCDLSFDSKIELDCPYAKMLKKNLPNVINKKCPLDDYEKPCKCPTLSK